MQNEENAVCREKRMQYAERKECSMQNEENAVCRERGMQYAERGECSMQRVGNAESYSGITSVTLSPVYYAHTAPGKRGMQYAE